MLTPETILSLTKKQGYFDVSLKWRSQSLMKTLNKLVEENKMKCTGIKNRMMRYILS